MRACRQHNHMFMKVVTPSVYAHSNISLNWMDFHSGTCTHIIWQRQCIKIKQPLHAAYFSRKSAKQPFLDWSVKNLLQPILPFSVSSEASWRGFDSFFWKPEAKYLAKLNFKNPFLCQRVNQKVNIPDKNSCKNWIIYYTNRLHTEYKFCNF